MHKTLSVWVFDDGRAGTFNQALGVAEALKTPFAVKKIKYTTLAKLPNFIRGKSTLGIAKSTVKELTSTALPDLIITAGRRAAPLARHLRHLSKSHTKLVQIMYAGKFGRKDFALIAIPKHDNLQLKGNNIFPITGAPHRVFTSVLQNAATKWHSTFFKCKKPFTAVIVGGSTKNRHFTEDMAEEFSAKVNALVGKRGSILLTTSRRTGKKQENILLSHLRAPKYVYKWGDKGENPYFGYLALADTIIVTGDSVSMCSEACSTSSPVFIYDNPALITPKHRRFLESLYKGGYASSLSAASASDNEAPSSASTSSSKAKHSALNAAEDIAARIHALFS